MRPLYVDISGTLDSKGNATIPVRVPRMTGNWHNAKLVVSTSAPAHWAVLVNGRPHDVRSGDRAVLGPVLVLDGESVAVLVTGGPPGATVDGTCTGVSGPPEQIMAGFAPSPGTVAVDFGAAAAFQGPLQGSPGGTTLNLTLPALATAILVICTAVDANSHVKVTGAGGKTYLDSAMTSIGQQLVAPTSGTFDPGDYAQNGITVTVSNATTTNTALYFVVSGAIVPVNSQSLPLWVVTSGFNVGITGQPIQVRIVSPAPPPPPNLTPSAARTSNGTTALLAPNGAQHVYFWDYMMAMSGSTSGVLADIVEHVSGNVLARLSENGTVAGLSTITGNASGKDLGAGAGLDLVATSIPVGGTVVATCGAAQQ